MSWFWTFYVHFHAIYLLLLLNIDSYWDDEMTSGCRVSVDLLRYIGEMLFELFSMLMRCSVIIIIKILFITHTCTTAYNIHMYVFYVQHNVEYANYICIKGFVLPYFVLNIHIYVYLMHLYMGVWCLNFFQYCVVLL